MQLTIPVIPRFSFLIFLNTWLIIFLSLLFISLTILFLISKYRRNIKKSKSITTITVFSLLISFFITNIVYRNCGCLIKISKNFEFNPKNISSLKQPFITLPIYEYEKGVIKVVFKKSAQKEIAQNDFQNIGLNLTDFELSVSSTIFLVPRVSYQETYIKKLNNDPITQKNVYPIKSGPKLYLMVFFAKKLNINEIKQWEMQNYPDLIDIFTGKADKIGVKIGEKTYTDPWRVILEKKINIPVGREKYYINRLKKLNYIEKAERIQSGWLSL